MFDKHTFLGCRSLLNIALHAAEISSPNVVYMYSLYTVVVYGTAFIIDKLPACNNFYLEFLIKILKDSSQQVRRLWINAEMSPIL